MRAKDAEWLDEQRDIHLQSGKLGECSSVYIGRVIVKLEEIGLEFKDLQAENKEQKDYITYLKSLIDGMSEKPTDHGKDDK